MEDRELLSIEDMDFEDRLLERAWKNYKAFCKRNGYRAAIPCNGRGCFVDEEIPEVVYYNINGVLAKFLWNEGKHKLFLINRKELQKEADELCHGEIGLRRLRLKEASSCA